MIENLIICVHFSSAGASNRANCISFRNYVILILVVPVQWVSAEDRGRGGDLERRSDR